MDLDLVRQLAAAANHLAVVATSRANGSVHASLVSAGVLDDPITGAPHRSGSWSAVMPASWSISARTSRRRRCSTAVCNGSPSRALCALAGPDDESGGISSLDVPSLLRAIFVAAGGTHDDWAEFDRVMEAERRVAVLIEAARITTNR